MAEEPSRKSFLEIAPSYLGGVAAIATAAVAVLSFFNGRDKAAEATAPDRSQVVNTHAALADPGRGVVLDAAPDVPAVSQKQAEVGPAIPGSPDVCRRIIGTWQWYTGDIPGVLTFGEDRQVGASVARGAAPVLNGSWSCDLNGDTYTIRWQNQVIERVTLGDDGRTASGSNNLNMPIRGSALPR